MRRFGLVTNFAIRSLLLTLVVAGALVWLFSWRLEQALTLESSRSLAAVLNSVLIHELEEMDLSQPMLGETRRDFDESLSEHFIGTDVTALRLWNANGELIYASDGRTDVGGDDGFAAAVAGEVAVTVSHDAAEDVRGRGGPSGSLIKTYAPLAASRSHAGNAIFEFYRPYAPVHARIIEARIILVGMIVFAALLMHVAQVSIVKRAHAQLLRSEAEVLEVRNRLEYSLLELEEHSLGTLQALASAVDAKDSYTARHSMAVADYAVAIGARLGLSAHDLADLERASLLHDVGKIGVSEEVLLKPSGLSEAEYAAVKAHADVGAGIIESIPFLRELVPIVRGHHERWDGKGYPAGLVAEEIPLLARILAVADSFDAMTSDRPYRRGMRAEDARAEFARHRGTQYDPRIVDALFEAIDAGDFESEPNRSARAMEKARPATAY